MTVAAPPPLPLRLLHLGPTTRTPRSPSCRGKVHGSLARAGKVKSQTPKVEPQEKKKKVTGRAKKRHLYNSRFVNVTAAPGAKVQRNKQPQGKSG
ncbi:hypothetical protein JCM3775_002305 [Rhodotorula graminis]